ncbi:MAG: tetratricopeptide repeat protein, partial [Saprospiraceae bacterium]|nr:tetratricopeptide repeat protein [Saprospiraceae bacterium]
MNKLQLTLLLIGLSVGALIYFGGNQRSSQRSQIEKSNKINGNVISPDEVVKKAKEGIGAKQLAKIEELEANLQKNDGNTHQEVAILKEISGEWYKDGFASASGYYAERVALLEPSDSAWSIAGSTYAVGLKQAKDDDVKVFCRNNGVKAFENAISLNPEETNYRLNLALIYTDMPLEDNPMKGILMLRELADKYPNNIGVLVALGRLAIQTGQYDKAKGRLEKAESIDPKNKVIICLLAEVYEALKDDQKSSKY